ncbi:Putative RmlC-like cupin (fragment) [Thiomonas sp. X19]|uniref:cupin domain-containing protein n=1 Tax=Thiomonas sp. X19 TaxID=1050370 RepID=UPI000B64212B
MVQAVAGAACHRLTAFNRMNHPVAFNSAGVQPEPGAWRVRYDAHEEEFCVLLEGLTLAADDGTARQFSAGDAFVVPGGFTGVWENHSRVRKHDAIMALAVPASG